MKDQPIMVYTTFANQGDAERVGGQLVEEKLAACVNILGGVMSIYRWQDKVERDEEVVMLVKSRASLKSALSKRLQELHPYETPAVFVIDGEALNEDYWQWLVEQTGGA